MKKYSLISCLFLISLLMQSCFFSEEEIFNEEPGQRVEASLKEYQKILTEAPNGWLLEYYAGGEMHDIGGVVLLMKFEGEDVTIASDTRVRGYGEAKAVEVGERVTSKYSLLKDQGPTLSFCTYNALIHYWSEPKGVFDADGLEGDFEFVITNATPDAITLKGKKHNTILTMKRMAEDMDWDTYLNNCKKVREESAEYATLVGYQNGYAFNKNIYSQSNVLIISKTDGTGKETTQKTSFAYTDKGIRLFEPLTVNDVTVNEFTWNATDKKFTATTDASVVLQYERPDYWVPIEFYTDNEWEASYSYMFERKDTTVNIEFTRLNESDTLSVKIPCGSMKVETKAFYNRITGMLEFRTQFLTAVQLTYESGEKVNAYLYLCPWNPDQGTMFMTETAGIVSEAKQLSPRILTFKDNGRSSGTSLEGFVFYAFKEFSLESSPIGVLESYNNIEFKQKEQE